MGATHRGRRARRRRVWLVLGAVALCLGGTLAVLGLAYGVGHLVRFLTVPSMEAGSGRKYTPSSGVKRYIEKRSEERPEK